MAKAQPFRLKATYVPIAKRSCSRSKKMHPSIARRVRTRYHLVFYFAITVAFRNMVSDEKIHFFINTAHDIRTPLTLIKAPLEDLREKEALSKEGIANMNTAIRNVNALLRLTTNLINFERADSQNSLFSAYL